MQDVLPFQAHSETSREAARSMEVHAGTGRNLVLQALIDGGGMTDEQLQDYTHLSPSTERPRRIELERAGRVIDSGERRKTRSGRNAVVWVAI